MGGISEAPTNNVAVTRFPAQPCIDDASYAAIQCHKNSKRYDTFLRHAPAALWRAHEAVADTLSLCLRQSSRIVAKCTLALKIVTSVLRCYLAGSVAFGRHRGSSQY